MLRGVTLASLLKAMPYKLCNLWSALISIWAHLKNVSTRLRQWRGTFTHAPLACWLGPEFTRNCDINESISSSLLFYIHKIMQTSRPTVNSLIIRPNCMQAPNPNVHYVALRYYDLIASDREEESIERGVIHVFHIYLSVSIQNLFKNSVKMGMIGKEW